MSLKWMWNGAPGSITSSAASRADAKESTSVKAPSLVACMCAKSSTGRTKSTYVAIAERRAELGSGVVVEPEPAGEPDLAGPVPVGGERLCSLLEAPRLGQACRADPDLAHV